MSRSAHHLGKNGMRRPDGTCIVDTPANIDGSNRPYGSARMSAAVPGVWAVVSFNLLDKLDQLVE